MAQNQLSKKSIRLLPEHIAFKEIIYQYLAKRKTDIKEMCRECGLTLHYTKRKFDDEVPATIVDVRKIAKAIGKKIEINFINL